MYFGTRMLILAAGAALMPHFAAAQEPRVSRYTAISAGMIQEARDIESDSIRAEAWADALESINEGLLREIDNPEAYLHLGIVHAELSHYLAADSAFDQAEAMYPEYVNEPAGTTPYRFNGWVAAYNEATAMLDAQDPEGAIEMFELANVLFDKRPEAYLNIGAQKAGLGEHEASIEAWQSAIAVIESPDIDPGDEAARLAWDTDLWTMAHTNLGIVLQMAERGEEAVGVYETILERFPENADARSALAVVLAATGQGAGALTIFEEILASETGSPLDYFNAGVSLYQAEAYDRAVVGFEKALGLSPMYRDALQNLVQALNVLENWEAQIPNSERLLEIDPHNEFGYQMHIRAMIQAGRQADGVAALEVMQGLPFVTDNILLQPMNAGASVSGQAINKTLPPGTSVTLRFTFYGNDSMALGTEDIEVTISDPEVAHPFQVSFDADVPVVGYGYEFVN